MNLTVWGIYKPYLAFYLRCISFELGRRTTPFLNVNICKYVQYFIVRTSGFLSYRKRSILNWIAISTILIFEYNNCWLTVTILWYGVLFFRMCRIKSGQKNMLCSNVHKLFTIITTTCVSEGDADLSACI